MSNANSTCIYFQDFTWTPWPVPHQAPEVPAKLEGWHQEEPSRTTNTWDSVGYKLRVIEDIAVARWCVIQLLGGGYHSEGHSDTVSSATEQDESHFRPNAPSSGP